MIASFCISTELGKISLICSCIGKRYIFSTVWYMLHSAHTAALGREEISFLCVHVKKRYFFSIQLHLGKNISSLQCTQLHIGKRYFLSAVRYYLHAYWGKISFLCCAVHAAYTAALGEKYLFSAARYSRLYVDP